MHYCYLLAALVASATAQHLGLYIPEVEADVHKMLSQYSNWVNFTGSGSLAAASPQPPKFTPQAGTTCSYWLEDIQHQGLAAFNSNPSGYKVFRNVKDFGAKGDGQTDDTAAINSAISSGGRCAPGSCPSSTTTPAVVYFPAGTYLISSSIIDYYYTQLIGNANCLPTIRAAPGFKNAGGTTGLIDADPYQNGGAQGYGSTNVFWRQIRNLVLDTTFVPASSSITGVHWPTAQATSMQNVIFQMASGSGTQHQGIFIENGSGGYLGNLIFNGGRYGLSVGNQQFTMRNLTFNNNVVGINQIWDWGWTYQGLHFNNNSIGLQMNSGGSSSLSVGSVTMLDSSFSNCPVGIVTGRSSSSNPPNANALILENIQTNNVPVIVQNANSATALQGSSGSTTVSAWGQGSSYTPNGPNAFQGSIPVAGGGRPSSLLSGSNYYVRSKPQYEGVPTSGFISARSSGAKGDGKTDDTSALQSAINTATQQNKILFVDHGDYLVTKTLLIPAGAKIVGESFSVILSSGSFFSDMSNPKPVVQIGNPGDSGAIEWSDMIVSTQGAQAGAILIQYNLASSSSSPTGLWDVHARIGGFAGSNLQVSQCPTTAGTSATSGNINKNCIAAFLSMQIAAKSSGLYMENNWLWTADHDVDSTGQTQITVYTGRGLLDQSSTGNIWLVGTAVEHFSLYQYGFINTKNVYAGQIQTESAYYQPNPDATLPFPTNSAYNDPTFTGPATVNTNNTNIPARNGWGAYIAGSSDILVYGAGLYSFFDNYSTTCSNQGGGETCQTVAVSIDSSSSAINFYNLNTVGYHWAFAVNGNNQGLWQSGQNGFSNNFARVTPGK